MGKYAESTAVSSEASRAEIERTLRRYGADGFMYGWDSNQAVVGFVVEGRQVRFMLPMPNANDRDFTHTPERGLKRSESQRLAAYEQAVKQRWRALNLVIKAKLEAVETGIVTFDTEFAMHLVLPDGSTVAEHVVPAVQEAYRTGRMPTTLIPALALEAGPSDSGA